MLNGTPRPDVLTRARELRANGATLKAIADALQAEKYPTGRGARWNATTLLSLLNSPHPHSAFLAPCSMCGDLTASKHGICTRRPECKLAWIKRSNDSKKQEDRRKPCTSCGRPTYSASGICARPSCWNEYQRARTAASGGGSFVYAVWFPTPRILKVGFSTHLTGLRFVASVRCRAKERNWDTVDSALIWKEPGDNRTEAWMQATLAFRWLAPFKQKDGRLCEWFTIPGLATEEITEILDDIYRLVPPDLTPTAPSLSSPHG